VKFEPYAARLAAACVHPASRWAGAVASVPRHVLVPRWWAPGSGGWELRDGPSDPSQWMEAAYENRTLVTRVGSRHADHATSGDTPSGYPTSSSTLPGLVVTMLRHAIILDEAQVLCVTGAGYTTAVLCERLGQDNVTSIDVDPYLVRSAETRLASVGLRPRTAVCDITGALPGTHDRIVSTVSVRTIPVSWLAALKPGGRLVTTLANTGLIVTADKTDDGGAVGQVEWDRAGFMATRHGEDYPDNGLSERIAEIGDQDGDEITTGRYPVMQVQEAWDVWSMLSLTCPGIQHRFTKGDGDQRTAWMTHPDGSWARASAVWDAPPVVHQGGPRRLWDELERIRRRLNLEGGLPIYGAKVTITPAGETTLSRGAWSVTLEPTQKAP
jgi:protein-L-isoaspartate O-methyltransferase